MPFLANAWIASELVEKCLVSFTVCGNIGEWLDLMREENMCIKKPKCKATYLVIIHSLKDRISCMCHGDL
jgi:hypothetical protein